ncbi:hypothetical protein [Chryseobacterium sp. 22543]|uniref:hypothetical protein n=1 Tax=Chryseobacterium sp. 22543 TaxID=3453940 RepID=UPI003F839B57
MELEQKKLELMESYVAPFLKEKEELIEEIKKHIEYHFNETPDCLYDIRDFINNKDSKFSQSVILTQPRIHFAGYDISIFEGQFLSETYIKAQKVLDDFKKETETLYKNLADIVIKKMDAEEEQEGGRKIKN